MYGILVVSFLLIVYSLVVSGLLYADKITSNHGIFLFSAGVTMMAGLMGGYYALTDDSNVPYQRKYENPIRKNSSNPANPTNPANPVPTQYGSMPKKQTQYQPIKNESHYGKLTKSNISNTSNTSNSEYSDIDFNQVIENELKNMPGLGNNAQNEESQ